MKKPGWFRLLDLFTFGLGGLASLGLLIYALFAGVQGAHAKEGLCLLAAVGFCFLAIWGKLAYDRKQWQDRFVWYPRYGFMIDPGGYYLPYTNSFKVDYDSPVDSLDSTAFAHELGHIIHGNATGQWDQEEHHQFAAAHGLK